jgi:predicted nucleotidyltransferase
MISRTDIARHRDAILELAGKYGASDLRLFGSVARGEQNVTSDVDLLVKMAKGTSLLDYVGLTQELGELLHCHVDVVNEKCLYPRIRDRVLAEAVPI